MLIEVDGFVGHYCRASSSQRIFGAFVQTPDIVTPVPLLIDFKECAGKTPRRQILDGKSDGL